MNTQPQLTLDVEMPQHARDLPHGGMLVASCSIDAVEIDRDLHPGDRITVTVASADGEVIGQAEQEVGGVGFKALKIDKSVVGLERVHKAKVVM